MSDDPTRDAADARGAIMHLVRRLTHERFVPDRLTGLAALDAWENGQGGFLTPGQALMLMAQTDDPTLLRRVRRCLEAEQAERDYQERKATQGALRRRAEPAVPEPFLEMAERRSSNRQLGDGREGKHGRSDRD